MRGCEEGDNPARWSRGQSCVRRHQRVDERGQQLPQQIRAGLGQLLVQEAGRVDTARCGHRVDLLRTVEGLQEDHAVAALTHLRHAHHRAGLTPPWRTPLVWRGARRAHVVTAALADARPRRLAARDLKPLVGRSPRRPAHYGCNSAWPPHQAPRGPVHASTESRSVPHQAVPDNAAGSYDA